MHHRDCPINIWDSPYAYGTASVMHVRMIMPYNTGHSYTHTYGTVPYTYVSDVHNYIDSIGLYYIHVWDCPVYAYGEASVVHVRRTMSCNIGQSHMRM